MDTAFFVASKLIWAVLRPDTWIAIGLALALLAMLLRRRGLALGLGGTTLAFVLLTGFVPLGSIFARPLEMRYPQSPELDHVDGIVILGGAEQAWIAAAHGWRPQVNDAAERFIEGALLAREWPEARVAFTGGSGGLAALGRVSWNAAMAADLLVELGVPRERIELEDASRNTAENAALGHLLFDPQPGETWVLVTSALHMPRAVATFTRAGWEGVVPWPVDYRSTPGNGPIVWNLAENLDQLEKTVKEYVGALAYSVTGR